MVRSITQDITTNIIGDIVVSDGGGDGGDTSFLLIDNIGSYLLINDDGDRLLLEDEDPPNILYIDFRDTTFPYGTGQDEPSSGPVTPINNGNGYRMEGNRWRCLEVNYDVQANTFIEFDIQCLDVPELAAVGFSFNQAPQEDTQIFELGGRASFSPPWIDVREVLGPTTVHFKINVGAYYTGSFQYLAVISDDDGEKDAITIYSNMKIYEED